MNLHVLRIPGEPRGWRIVTAVRAGKPCSNLAKNAAKWRKEAVRVLQAEWDGPPMDGPLFLGVDAVFARPQRLECSHKPPCGGRAAEAQLCPSHIISGRDMPHVSTPDATNVHKLAEDALVKAGVLLDDRSVCKYGGGKRYARRGEEPHVRIELWEVAT